MAKPEVAIVVALDLHGGYSKDGVLPFNSKVDMDRFRSLTTGHKVVIGRLTYEEILGKTKPEEGQGVLKGRQSFVLTSKPETILHGTGFTDIGVVGLASMQEDEKVFFIGGEQVFLDGLACCDKVYVTVFNKDLQCDKFFPTHVLDRAFDMVKNEEHLDAENPENSCIFLTFTKKEIKP